MFNSKNIRSGIFTILVSAVMLMLGCTNVYANAYRKGETYTVEDVAIAKKLANKFFTEYFQDEYNKLLQNNYPWLPDERKIKLE